MKSVVKLIMVGVAITTALLQSYWWGSTIGHQPGVTLSAATNTEKNFILPQSNGIARYLPGTQKGYHGNGLSAGL